MAKLTKVQREFFNQFARNAIVSLLLAQTKPEYSVAVQEAAEEVLAGTNLTSLANAIGELFLAQVDFKTIVKVDKFLKTPEYLAVAGASNVVLAGVSEELGQALVAVAEGVEAAQTTE